MDAPLFEVTEPAADAAARRLTTAAKVRALIGSPAGDDTKIETLIDGISAECAAYCRLARPAEEITLGEVVRLMEGGIHLTVCCGEKANNCPRKEGCLTRKAWMQVSTSLERELDSITLAGLAHGGDQVCPEGVPGGVQDKIVVRGEPVIENMGNVIVMKNRGPSRRVKGLRR